MPSFAVSIVVLSVVQAAVVLGPGERRPRLLTAARSRWWALLPAGSIAAFVVGVSATGSAAHALTWLALVAVPLLAAAALAWLMRGGRVLLAPLAGGLFALAWVDRGGLAGESAALALEALSCVTLGVLIAAITPARALKAGIVLMACVDAALVISDQLQGPNGVLNAVAPPAHLPHLQDAVWGNALLGYGDLFVAGVLGAVLAARVLEQDRAALLALILALAFDALFLVVDELPATVPIALALILSEGWERVARERGRRNEPQQAPDPAVSFPQRGSLR